MIEMSESDERLSERYVHENDLSRKNCAKRSAAPRSEKILPVLCGCALKNIGIQRLLDGVVDYLPSPVDMPPVKGLGPGATTDHDEASDRGAVLRPGVQDHQRPAWGPDLHPHLLRPPAERQPRLQRAKRSRKEHQPDVPDARRRSRDPGLAERRYRRGVGVKDASTGDTLCDETDPIILESKFPDPVISMSMEPKTAADKQKLGEALGTLKQEDPTFRFRTIAKPARPFSPAWANCTWKSS